MWKRLGKSNVYSVVVGDWGGVKAKIMGKVVGWLVYRISRAKRKT